MKVICRALLLFWGITCFPGSESFAQGGWSRQNITDLYAVAALDGQTVVAVDSFGRALRSTNGGSNWTPQYIGTSSSLFGLSFPSSAIGYAVGEAGTIRRTFDQGQNWFPQPSGTGATLIGVFFSDVNNGTAVGEFGTILRTTNGGANWTPQYSGSLNTLFGVSFVDLNIGMAVGDSGTILRTSNGGATWTLQFSGTTRHLQTVSFLDANTAVVVGDLGTILRTTDGGDTWISQPSPERVNLYGLSFRDRDVGVSVGCATSVEGDCQPVGIILRTGDGGLTWNSVPAGNQPLYAVSLFPGSGFAVGGAATVARTADDGGSWHDVAAPQQPFLQSVSMVNASTGFAVGEVIVGTWNGGATWYRLRSGSEYLWAVFFVNENIGWAAGGGDDDCGTILHTTDGGSTWTRQFRADRYEFIRVLYFVNADIGYAIDFSGNLLDTSDGGATWTRQFLGEHVGLSSIAFGDPNFGIAVGADDGGALALRTFDGGATWTRLPFSSVYGSPKKVAFADSSTVVVSFDSRYVLRSTDRGTTWTSASVDTRGPGYYQWFEDVTFGDANTGTAVVGWYWMHDLGRRGWTILRTRDGGASWRFQTDSPVHLTGVSFVDASTGTAVGETILHTVTGGD